MYAVLIANLDDFFYTEATDKIEAYNKALAVYGPNRVLSYCIRIT